MTSHLSGANVLAEYWGPEKGETREGFTVTLKTMGSDC